MLSNKFSCTQNTKDYYFFFTLSVQTTKSKSFYKLKLLICITSTALISSFYINYLLISTVHSLNDRRTLSLDGKLIHRKLAPSLIKTHSNHFTYIKRECKA